MRRVAIVTGFVPIPDHPRPVEVYQESLNRLHSLEFPICIFKHDVDACWLWQYLEWGNLHPKHAVADNPKKNTVAYHCVQHQKCSWILSSFLSADIDLVVYIDAGIFTVPGITEDVIKGFLAKVENERAVSIPGCWTRAQGIPADEPCWRFCGGLWIVPRPFAFKLDAAMRFIAIDHLERTNRLDWEVNTLARVEACGMLPISWYKADHNQLMFSAYPESRNAD